MPTLDWLTREEDIKAANRVPYRLLEPDPALSAGDPEPSRNGGNMLIQGDNLDALKSLLPYYAGRVKCIYIDPPYNTRSAFEHYDDNLEHSRWLAMIWPRLELLRELLSEDGSIWVSIDDHEGHYLKVVMDEVFGRKNFIGNIVWQSKDTPGNDATTIAQTHNHNLVYARSNDWYPRRLPRTAKQLANYKNLDGDSRGPWLGTPLTRAEHRDRDVYALTNSAGREVLPPKGSSWRRPPEELRKLADEGRIYWGKTGDSDFPMEKKFLSEVKEGVVPQTWWPYDFAGSTRNASAELKKLFGGIKSFDTPKPERLLEKVFQIATNPGDLVLDTFLGSGTTAAVAHKMGRRWIGVEMGDHAVTHCAPRLRKVIEGEQGGISQSVGWQGGGGFTFYRLGAQVFDGEGRIRAGIRFAALAAHVWFSETGVPLVLPGTGRGTATRSGVVEGALSPAVRAENPLHQPSAGPPPRSGEDFRSPFLGVHDGKGYALLYNGVLGDKRPNGGNVLTNATLALIREAAGGPSSSLGTGPSSPLGTGFGGPLIVYGEASRLSAARLKAEGVTFKQTPYDVKAR